MTARLSRELLYVLILFVIASGATVISLLAETRPGRLAIELGLTITFFGAVCASTREAIFRAIGVTDAGSQLVVAKALTSVIWASLGLIILGFLNLMGAFPWWP
jgi:hypothetical protein